MGFGYAAIISARLYVHQSHCVWNGVPFKTPHTWWVISQCKETDTSSCQSNSNSFSGRLNTFRELQAKQSYAGKTVTRDWSTVSEQFFFFLAHPFIQMCCECLVYWAETYKLQTEDGDTLHGANLLKTWACSQTDTDKWCWFFVKNNSPGSRTQRAVTTAPPYCWVPSTLLSA